MILSAIFLFGFYLLSKEAAYAAPSQNFDRELEQIIHKFVNEYPKLNIPPVQLDYASNMTNIANLPELEKQHEFFASAQKKLKAVKAQKLTAEAYIQFVWLQTIVEDHLDRIRLEAVFKKEGTLVPDYGLFNLSSHRQWYNLYSRRFASRSITPLEIQSLGLEEIEKIRASMTLLQSDLGYAGRDLEFQTYLNSESFQFRDLSSLQQQYEAINAVAMNHLANLFPWLNPAPAKIAKELKASKDTPPGRYSRKEKTFFYSFYNQNHNRRSMEWLVLHESAPGHHYQYQIEDKSNLRPAFAKWFNQYGFTEGWATYVEDLGSDLNLYSEATSRYGKLEWDIIRSLRLIIDVSIHVHGWTKSQALIYWKKILPFQNEIAEREIDRIIRWPAQVISYKVGEREIKKIENQLRNCLKKAFDRKHFHKLLLERGNLPFSALKIAFTQEMKSRGCR